MYDELQANKLNVVLVQAPEKAHIKHMIRVAESRNPGWYQEICANYPDTSDRRTSSIIKRSAIKTTLKQLFRYGKSEKKYAPDLIEIAEDYLARLKEQYGE